MKTIKIQLEIDERRVADLLCNALEGGSDYWSHIKSYNEPKEITFDWRSDARNEADEIYRHIHYPMSKTGSIVIRDTEDQKDYILNREAIEAGLTAFANLKQGEGGHHFSNFLNEQDDAETGDVFLQCCLFNEIIYG